MTKKFGSKEKVFEILANDVKSALKEKIVLVYDTLSEAVMELDVEQVVCKGANKEGRWRVSNTKQFASCKVRCSIMEKITTTSCGCCVIRFADGKPQILLVRPFADRDAWGIPKGHIEENESFEECALRETREETGIQAVLLDQLCPVQANFKQEKKTVRAFLAYQYEKTQVPVTLDDENVDAKFFSFENLPTIHVYQRPLIAETLERVLQLGESSFSKNGE